MNKRVLVIAGGLSAERDVSVRSGRRIAEDLREAGFDGVVADIDAALIGALQDDPPACAIPLVHGAAGEDGSLQEVLQSFGVGFVGSDADGCRRTFDKAVASALMREVGVHSPACVALPQSMFRDLGAPALLGSVCEQLGLPLVVKPNRGGSALGVTIVTSPEELPAAMVAAFAYSDVVLIQRHVSGTEIAVAVIEVGEAVALPVVEIVPDSGIYDYAARYTAGSTEFFVPARLEGAVLQAAQDVALKVHSTLGLRDWSRSDLIVDSEGTVWFLEANVAPGMTETSLVPQAVLASDFTMGELLGELVEQAAARAATIAT